MYKVDLNCDMGEGYGVYDMPADREIIKHVTSANIACGFHASDPMTMDRTVALAAAYGVAVGAHPGYPDREGFGRRHLSASADEIYDYVLYQLGALDGIARAHSVRVGYVKAHGAMYNTACVDITVARALCRAVRDYDAGMKLLAMSGGCMQRAAEEYGVPFVAEVFADRAYRRDGTLVGRGEEGAVIHDRAELVRRAVRMVKEGTVTAVDGGEIRVCARSVCIHSDSPGAAELAAALREAFASGGIAVESFV